MERIHKNRRRVALTGAGIALTLALIPSMAACGSSSSADATSTVSDSDRIRADSSARSDIQNAVKAIDATIVEETNPYSNFSSATCDASKATSARQVNWSNGPTSVTISCSPGVTLTVKPTSSDAYTITASHINGTLEYKYDSTTKETISNATS